MTIHVVQPEETIYSIAEMYQVSVTNLIVMNGLTNPQDLVVGQTIVIPKPTKTLIIQEKTTLQAIAESEGISTMQLLRNNPQFSDRESVLPGELIVISYEQTGKLAINGYVYPFVLKDVLKKTLPYLTYLTIFNYRSIGNGEIVGEDDTDIIKTAYEYGVAPLMSLSTLTYQGQGDIKVVNSILNNYDMQTLHINSMMNILRSKNYYGINISIAHLNQENRPEYESYITRLYSILRGEGFQLFLTVTPRIAITTNGVTTEKIDLSKLAQVSDGIMVVSYVWGSASGLPMATNPAYVVNDILNYTITKVPTDKLYLGISTIAYDWQLPHILGTSQARSLSNEAAIDLAVVKNATIFYNEVSQAPYFEYVDYSTQDPIRHIVWFNDARSIDALIKLIYQNSLEGTSIWNAMSYFAQMWLVINSQYEITKVLPEP